MTSAPGDPLELHEFRRAALAELHARPFAPIATPSRILHFGFVVDASGAAAAAAELARLARERGLPPIDEGAKHIALDVGAARLVFEKHGEFVTYTWVFPGAGEPFQPASQEIGAAMRLVPQPGPLLSSCDLHVVAEANAPADFDAFLAGPVIAVSEIDDGRALAASDFRADAFGFVRFLVVDRRLSPMSAGALAQRLLEIETYRLLALTGLPLAQKLAPSVRSIETALPTLLRSMNERRGLDANRDLLDQLTLLATDLESGAAESLYRFGATRAYGDLVRRRLEALKEVRVPGHSTLGSFLARRFEPALGTCAALEARQSDLSAKIARAAELLRTRVDVEMESQNMEELRQMAERQRLQLRLQQTVEGLSVAAITYYVSSILHLLFEGAHDAGWRIDPQVATAAAVPFVAGLVAWQVWRIRRRHRID